MFNEKPKNELIKLEEEDKYCYFYDITPYIKYIIGEFVEKADIHLGYIFKEDTDFEQERDLLSFKDTACKIDKSFEKTKRIDIEHNSIIRITFTNKKRIEISSMDYGYLRES